MNVVLVGYRGSGKSTIGPILANRLGFEFLDLDRRIEEDTGRSIAAIFASEGEPGFRRRESEALAAIRAINRHVVALGGGALLDPMNKANLKRVGKVVWLRAPAVVLWSRIKADPKTRDTRPDLTSEGGLAEVESRLAEREPDYQECARHVIDTVSMSPEDLAESIELWFRAADSQSD